MKYNSELANKITWAGTVKNPIAIDTYRNLYANLDDEFYRILNIYSWFKTGLVNLKVQDLDYKIALGLKYLIDYNEIEKRGLLIG